MTPEDALCCYGCAVREELQFQRAQNYEEGICASCGTHGLMAQKSELTQKLHG